MRRPRFFLAQTMEPGTSIDLPEHIVQHLLRVLRMAPGDELILFNGEGGEYQARIIGAKRSSVRAKVESYESKDVESPLKTRLGLGILRGKAMDSALTRATELGVSTLTPLLTEHCSIRRSQLKFRHWEKVIHASCEQCGRTRVPELTQALPVAEWLDAQRQAASLRLVADPRSRNTLKSLALPEVAVASVDLLVGPEGGLSQAEVDQALGSGFLAVSLGPRILRAETVPTVLLTLAQHYWGDT